MSIADKSKAEIISQLRISDSLLVLAQSRVDAQKSEIERLQRENAELRDQVKELTLPDGMTWGQIMDAAFVSVRIERLRAKLAAAEVDTKRLDRIVKDLKRDSPLRKDREYCILHGNDKHGWDYEGSGAIGNGKTPREAIDAAMAAQKGGES